uniref:Uncharacterized protein n=1 Tax=Knipowitschia caucasica TaxID=637954 RepID=A0AAV2JR71_KNICA
MSERCSSSPCLSSWRRARPPRRPKACLPPFFRSSSLPHLVLFTSLPPPACGASLRSSHSVLPTFFAPSPLLVSNWSRSQQEQPVTSNYSSVTVVLPSSSSSSSSPCPASPELLIPRQQDTSHSPSSAEEVLRLPLGIEQCDGEAHGALDDGYADAKHLEEDDDEEVQPPCPYEPHSCSD